MREPMVEVQVPERGDVLQLVAAHLELCEPVAGTDAAGFRSAGRVDPSTTTQPNHTRQPKNRTDLAVVRRRHWLQQTLSRIE